MENRGLEILIRIENSAIERCAEEKKVPEDVISALRKEFPNEEIFVD